MVTSSAAPRYNTQFDSRTGTPVPVADGIVRVTAPNPSAYTFTGTNTFILGHDRVAIMDPGPVDGAHEQALIAAIRGRPVAAIVLTHTHRDHSALARSLAERLRAPLWFGGPHRLSRPLRRFERDPVRRSGDWNLVPDRMLVDGEVFEAGDLSLSVHATPGHCANHLVFGVVGTDILLSGDHVMGWNSTVVAVPDGSMADYFASLDKVIALPFTRYVPAHGGEIEDGRSHAEALKAHRQMRNRQVVNAVAQGARTVGAVVSTIYPNQPVTVRLADQLTMLAHIEYLEAQGELVVKRGLFGTRLSPA
jgi:glyoxylase-like metal-dependent hydrolase (beta-lactamase superfamily II)